MTLAAQNPRQAGGLNQTDTVAATTGTRRIGPFEPSVYNDSNGDAKRAVSEIPLTVSVLVP